MKKGRRTLGSGSLAPIFFGSGRRMGAECNTTVTYTKFFLRKQHISSFLPSQISFPARFDLFFFRFKNFLLIRTAQIAASRDRSQTQAARGFAR
jgi:hypothetical protein